MDRYDHTDIEKKWQKRWAEAGVYNTEENSNKPKAYVLDMFPYPSGEGLHVGHPRGYVATDVYSRMKRMQGYNVLHPMGWDAFGLPAENFAIKNKVHPREAVEKNIARFKEQLAHIGFDYDWNREINTTDPEYYTWTQWIFLKLYEKGLAHESYEPINWCPSCQTGLANEDIENDGTCERCGALVEKKPMRQWVLKITDYADRLLADLETLNEWPEHIKEAQRNWIGRSEGAEIKFSIKGSDKSIAVFTTRPDTLFGATYMVLAPEHPLVSELAIENRDEVDAYVQKAAHKSAIERAAEGKQKTGVLLKGVNAINPANNEEIPLYIADYVLAEYGTGAIMAVPAHDERDKEFAEIMNLPIQPVVLPYDLLQKYSSESEQAGQQLLIEKFKSGEFVHAVSGEGILINSGEFDGLEGDEAKQKITEHVGGRMTTTYKIQDWVFSRQRYWGEPIPIIHCQKCGAVPVPEKNLPVILPDVEQYEPTGTGESPLANIEEWVNTSCPKCDSPAKRETNTMPQWAGSSWYWLRFMDPCNNEALVTEKKEKQWGPVDVYVGGDHAVRHLIYARFWHKFLYDINVVHTIEPFARLEFLGFILAEDGRKMSKRWGNVINPDDVIKNVGADSFRMYEMFIGPFENAIAWSTNGLVGVRRFLERVWRLADELQDSPVESIEVTLNQTIQKVNTDIEHFKFNTAVSQMMIFVNEAEKKGISRAQYTSFLKLLAPFAPHMAEELWERLGNDFSVHTAPWPEHDPKKAISEEVKIALQINGKTRGAISVPRDSSEEEVIAQLKINDKTARYIDFEPRKIIFVPNRIINFIH
ncbi:MAG: leucine--tRNA ligase [Patescibacteria group bacterium UBA2163]